MTHALIKMLIRIDPKSRTSNTRNNLFQTFPVLHTIIADCILFSIDVSAAPMHAPAKQTTACWPKRTCHCCFLSYEVSPLIFLSSATLRSISVISCDVISIVAISNKPFIIAGENRF